MGSVFNPDTQEAKLFELLKDGQQYSVWSLITLIPSAAVHSVVSNLRLQLPPGQTIENEMLWRPALKRTDSYYRLIVE